jgi:hypothetical protein
MFGTLRRITSTLTAKLKRLTQPKTTPVAPAAQSQPRRAYVLHRIRRFRGIMDALANTQARNIPTPLHTNGGKRPRVKGQRDRSLQSRSNRRKAAR